ncbi:unnamed protein product [Mesocestoides corti]|uniref:Ubiquitin-like domain-containing protein n=1 Tax=Mesocestoides corti TaxID=53468 RepID=A0A0R3UIV1_MESCO|nr:unnamed protein product [Mesocestoides corti]
MPARFQLPDAEDGTCVTVNCDFWSDLIIAIKQKIENDYQIPARSQRFIYKNKEMLNDQTLIECNYSKEDIILVQRIADSYMKIHVYDEEFQVMFVEMESVECLIKRVAETRKIQPKQVALETMRGTPLENKEAKVEDYGLGPNEELRLTILPEDVITVIVNTIFGTTFQCNISCKQNIGELKDSINNYVGSTRDSLNLSFQGKQKAVDSETLEEAGIKDNSRVYVMQRVHGGINTLQSPPSTNRFTFIVAT